MGVLRLHAFLRCDDPDQWQYGADFRSSSNSPHRNRAFRHRIGSLWVSTDDGGSHSW
jgi:hypothetical protein